MAGSPGQNVFQQSANGLNSAGQAAQGVANYQPMQVQAGQVAGTNLSPYLNPFTQAVTDRTMATLDQQRQQALNGIGAQATAAGAFGGSRHGVAEAETNRAFADTAASTVAGLNQANFSNAMGLAQGDIASRMQAQLANQSAGLQGANTRLAGAGQLGGLANLGFGMGMQIQGQQAQQGAQQQAMQQALIDAAKAQFGGVTGAPAQSLAQLLGGASGVPYGQSQTTSQKPGLLNIISAGLGLF